MGADLVLFSGDKLLGGPQCGIVVGRAELIARLRANPLARVVRVDKLTLAALQATLEIHRAGRAFSEIPVLQQLSLTADEIRARGERVLTQLRAQSATPKAFSLVAVASASGGGALPEIALPSWAIAIASASPDDVAGQLRVGSPAVLPRVKEGSTLIDLRTVLPKDEDALLMRILACRLELAT
jgi:L-seryl-tRNA(Ser) seleniumtransferase